MPTHRRFSIALLCTIALLVQGSAGASQVTILVAPSVSSSSSSTSSTAPGNCGSILPCRGLANAFVAAAQASAKSSTSSVLLSLSAGTYSHQGGMLSTASILTDMSVVGPPVTSSNPVPKAIISGANINILNTKTTVTFQNIQVESGQDLDSGGCFYVARSSTLELDNCVVTNCFGDAGAVLVDNDGALYATSTTFSYNQGDTGGAISAFTGSVVSLFQSYLTGNSATNGGGIFMSGGQLLTSDCSFDSNIAAQAAGGVYFRSATGSSINATSFTGNSANSQGGAFYVYGPYDFVNFDDITVTGNVAGSLGGAVYVNRGEVFIQRSVISGNNAITGGAFGINADGVVELVGVTLTQNSASRDGGAIEIQGYSELDARHSSFTANSAGRDGGAVYCESSKMHFHDSILEKNGANHSDTSALYCASSRAEDCKTDKKELCEPDTSKNTNSGEDFSRLYFTVIATSIPAFTCLFLVVCCIWRFVAFDDTDDGSYSSRTTTPRRGGPRDTESQTLLVERSFGFDGSINSTNNSSGYGDGGGDDDRELTFEELVSSQRGAAAYSHALGGDGGGDRSERATGEPTAHAVTDSSAVSTGRAPPTASRVASTTADANAEPVRTKTNAGGGGKSSLLIFDDYDALLDGASGGSGGTGESGGVGGGGGATANVDAALSEDYGALVSGVAPVDRI